MTRRAAHIDRRGLFSSAAAAAVLAASGVSAASVPQRGGRLRMALSGATRRDSWSTGDGLFMQVARQGMVFDTLTEVAADGTLRAELATGWQASADARVWTFDVRPNVLFHDGAPLTARDIVASFAMRLDGQIRQAGALQVEITLNTPNTGLPMLLSGPEWIIRPAHAPESGIGTGMYRVKQFIPGRQLLAQRVSDHYKDGTAGWFDEVELTSIPSEPVRGQALSEYMVDAVDLNDARALAHVPEIAFLPDRRRVMQAISTDVAHPLKVSDLRPLDNLRAAERWWFA